MQQYLGTQMKIQIFSVGVKYFGSWGENQVFIGSNSPYRPEAPGQHPGRAGTCHQH
jgi:hypothetical protein